MRKAVIACLLAVALLSGCGSAGQSQKTNYLDGPEHADAKALFRSNRCITCHATNLSGNAGMNSNIQQVGKRLTKEEIIQVITHGKKAMPAYQDKLSPEEIDTLATWLAELK